MAVEIKRKPNESIENFMRRFTRRMIESRVLINAKKRRFYERPKSEALTKASAIRRKKLQEEREYLRKIGKTPEEFLKKGAPRFRPGSRSRTVSRISVRG